MTTVEMIDKVLAWFGPNGERWTNKQADGKCQCVYRGAVCALAGREPDCSGVLQPRDWDKTYPDIFLDALVDKMGFVCEYTGVRNCSRLFQWNDSPDRKWEDVRDLLLAVRNGTEYTGPK
jgi:hypothetical protein